MMPPAFGFSVGDFIAAIALCTKVAKALKEAGGVGAEYQQVIIEIEGLQHALSRLAALEPTESNIDHVNAIRRMALACSFPLRDFLSKLETYEATMSPFATGTSFRSAGKKARYAIFVSDEVKSIRAMISGKVISINLLLATHASETLSRTESQLSINQKSVLARLEEAKGDMNSIRQEIERMNAVTTSHEQLQQERTDSTQRLTEQFNQLTQDAAGAKRNISALTIGVASISTSVTTLRELASQVLAILRSFPAELRTLLQTVLRTNTQMYAILLEVHRKIGARPTLALDSNIRIEDALGEVRSLPFEWFRHWEPFEGLLRAEFKNRLGAERVERGDFRLVQAKRPNISYDKNNWFQTITTGVEILMLIVITDLTCQESFCPRESCNGRTALKADKQAILTCPECGLRFIPQLVLPDSTEANMIEKLQFEEDTRLFGLRNEPYSREFSSLYPEEDSTPQDTEELAEDLDFSEGGSPSTHKSTTAQSLALRDMSRKPKAAPDTADNQPEPPIYTWLAGTEPPRDPDSVLKWREEEEIRRAKRQKQNAQDLEVFRNVEVAFPFKDDVPTSDAHNVVDLCYPGTDKSTTGAYVLYRNILDQYPKLGGPLAWRFANVNWKRMENFQRQQLASPAFKSLPVETLDEPKSRPYGGWEADIKVDNAPNDAPTHPSFSNLPKRRKLCSLPPPPWPLPVQESGSTYDIQCHLCSEVVRIRRKRDWSNHVMDDLLPYLCPFVDCSTGEDTYARRRELSAHIKLCHPHEIHSLCQFCGKEVEFGLIKHLGHHMEEIAFGALSTAYEEWSYDDSDSEVAILSACSRSTFSIERERPPKHSSSILYHQPSFAKSSHPNEHADKHNHEGPHEAYCYRLSLEPTTFQGVAQPVNANEESVPMPSPFAHDIQRQSDKRDSFADALDPIKGMFSLSQQDRTPPHSYSPISETWDPVNGCDLPPSSPNIDNYWTRSSHPSSSASSVNSQLRYSVSDYLDSSHLASKTSHGSSALKNCTSSAPMSAMGHFSSEIASGPEKKYKCELCGKYLTSLYDLETHMYNHKGKQRKCD